MLFVHPLNPNERLAPTCLFSHIKTHTQHTQTWSELERRDGVQCGYSRSEISPLTATGEMHSEQQSINKYSSVFQTKKQ